MSDTLAPVVVKYGGSSLDLELDWTGRHDRAILTARDAFNRLLPVRPIVVMPGGGPSNELFKALKKNYQEIVASREARMTFAQCFEDVLSLNARVLRHFWAAKLVDPRRYNSQHALRRELGAGISVVPFAPPSVVRRYRLSPDKSDSLTLAMAEILGSPLVVFLKDTDGIFNFDQKWISPEFKERRFFMEIGGGLGPRRAGDAAGDGLVTRDPDRGVRRLARKLEHKPVVTAAEMLSAAAVWRVGAVDGDGDHLIETDAIRFFRRCKAVQAILIGQVTNAVHIFTKIAQGEALKEKPDIATDKYSVLVRR